MRPGKRKSHGMDRDWRGKETFAIIVIYGTAAKQIVRSLFAARHVLELSVP